MFSDEKWTNGSIYRFAGTGNPGYSGDGGKADEAQLNGPAGRKGAPHGAPFYF